MQKIAILTDVNSDQQQGGRLADLNIDRPTVARPRSLPQRDRQHALRRLRPTPGVRPSTSAVNQYHVVMEVAPALLAGPPDIEDVWVSTSGANPSGTQITNASAGAFTATTAATHTALDDRRPFGGGQVWATIRSRRPAFCQPRFAPVFRVRPRQRDDFDPRGRLRQTSAPP